MNKKYLYLVLTIFTSLINIQDGQAVSCVSSDCNALGYTKQASDCSGVDSLRCPFDSSKYHCKKPVQTIPCTTMGAFYNSDKTCTENVEPTKTPVGIVFDTSGKIMGLETYKNDSASAAITFCKTIGWRLPNINELKSISNPFLILTNKIDNNGLTEICDATYYGCRFWSSTPKYTTNNNFYKVIHLDTGYEDYDQDGLGLGEGYRCIKDI